MWSGSDCIGIFGQIHPLAAQNYGVDAELYCAELSFDELLNAKGPDPEYVPLPRFPAVTRDIAVVCGEKVTVGALEDCIRRGAKNCHCYSCRKSCRRMTSLPNIMFTFTTFLKA